MARALVIADDLTGANACAAGFARNGLRAVTVGLGRRWSAITEFHPRFDVVVVTTESRHSPPREAAEMVQTAARAGWPVELLACRIDTTLRGNVGVASEAMIDVARELSGQRVVGLCQPAYPQAGRLTVDGRQLLNGQRLEETELAHDVRTPMRTSDVAEILNQNTSLVTRLLSIGVVTGPRDVLVSTIREMLQEDVDVLIADGLTTDHISRVAQAAVQADPTVRWVAIDPGPGALALSEAMGIEGETGLQPVLVVSGSATELTQRQLARLISERDPVVVRPVTRAGSAMPDVDASATALVAGVRAADPGQVVLFATVLEHHDIGTLTTDEASSYAHTLGEITRRVLHETGVDGLYTTGGDITAAVLESLNGQGIEIHDEVVPLAVAGEIVGGPWTGLPIVTKGGLIGTADTALACVDHLLLAAQQRRRWVSSSIPREASG